MGNFLSVEGILLNIIGFNFAKEHDFCEFKSGYMQLIHIINLITLLYESKSSTSSYQGELRTELFATKNQRITAKETSSRVYRQAPSYP